MQIFIMKGGDELGPLNPEEVRSLLANGKIMPSDQAWYEGAKGWAPLSTIAAVMSSSRKTVVSTKPKTQTQAPNPSPAAPMASLSRDWRHLKTHSSATAKELREFLHELRGKPPREMLGAIAQSSLMRSLTLASGIVAGGFVVFTGLALWMDKGQAQPGPAAPSAIQAQPAPNSGTLPKASAAKKASGTNEEKAAKAMGVADVKKGQPKMVDPFNTKGDDFGKDLQP